MAWRSSKKPTPSLETPRGKALRMREIHQARAASATNAADRARHIKAMQQATQDARDNGAFWVY